MISAPALEILAQGHDHTLTVPVTIGPLILRVGLLTVMAVVAGYALLRVSLPEQNRTTTLLVASAAAGGVVLELMLADGLRIPSQAVVFLLAGVAVPFVLMRREGTAAERVRAVAPLVIAAAAALACVQFGRGWLGDWRPDARAVFLHTGVVLALAALSWLTICRPRSRPARVLVRVEAVALALVVMAGTAHATVLRPPYPPEPGVPIAAELGDADVLVVPHRPGWNAVQVVNGDGASVGTDPDALRQTAPVSGATGVWGLVHLRPGANNLWVRRDRTPEPIRLEAGGAPSPEQFGGPDAAECATAFLGSTLAGAPHPRQCPAEYLSEHDAEALRNTVTFLASRSVPGITLVTDSSPRSARAEQTVRQAAAEAGITVGSTGPTVLVSGWATAEKALRDIASGVRPAEGSYLAPWLLTAPLLTIPAGQLIPLRHAPTEELALRYDAELRARYPGQVPSWTGFTAWLAKTPAELAAPVRLYAASTVNVLPVRPEHHTGSQWLAGGAITAVTGPLDAR